MSSHKANNQKQIELSPEVVRMAQIRASRQGLQFRQELARLVAEEAVVDLDCELGLLLENELSMNQSDVLAASLGVSDIVVNGHRLDVRAIDEDGEVVITRALVGSPYLSMGSLLVKLEGVHGGTVVGHLSSGAWLKAEDGLRDADPIRVPVSLGDFNFAEFMVELTNKAVLNLPGASKLVNFKTDVNELINEKGRLIVARQKQIFSYLCSHWSEETMAAVEAIGYKLPAARVTKVLLAAGRWNAVVEKASDKLAVRFTKLSKDEIRHQVMAVGERFGGEIKGPAFRSELLQQLAASELARSSTVPVNVAQSVLAKVMAGVSAADAVKGLVKNAVAVDLALSIKNKRQAAVGFMAATADEIGMAFQQLALQPAYATHSAADSGVDSINEALALLSATDMADTIKACDREMAEL
ncbi:MAG: hypothetical protein QG574_2691 [Cyanobacteriota bacterium erpe_2018_sw_21hr_WHONDRS-SW48-000092_B_bin.40]|jgi:hypothetical protein|nr:hypothetical protein [Cyanobacteriota bacterium erpe_2018_sw_21hr_WHONDRS-SW48-000092_B_bin.40]